MRQHKKRIPLNYYQKRKKCSKPTCHTCIEQGGHGPYWYASHTVAGKTVETYIGKQLPFAVPQTVGRPDQAPLVGRIEELEHLREILDRVEESKPLDRRTKAAREAIPAKALSAHCVMLLGEGGVGKTRVAEELAREAIQRQWAIVWCHASSPEGSAYHLWAEVLRKTMSQGLWKRQLVTRHPLLYQPLCQLLLELADLPQPFINLEPFRLWEAIHALLCAMCGKTALLVVFDDLHCADPASCELLAYLARQMGEQPILFLCTYRNSELPSDHPLRKLLIDLQQEQNIEQITIRPLSNAELCQLVSGVPEPLARKIVALASGNTFFAEELARSLVGTAVTETSAFARAYKFPRSVQAVLDHRLGRISLECQRLLERGAVLGQSFFFDVLCNMASGSTPVDEDEILDLIQESLQASILTEEESNARLTYHFWHPLLQTRLYHRLSPARRASFHRKAARTLQTITIRHGAEEAAQIAGHLKRSDAPPTLIAHYAEIAADYAYSLSAYQDGSHWYRVTLEHIRLLKTSPEQQEREARVLELLGECTRIQGKHEEAGQLYQEALQIYQAGSWVNSDDSTAQVQALLWAEIGLCNYDANDLAQARQCYTRGEGCLRKVEIKGGPAWARLYYEKGYLAWREGKYTEARSLALKALSFFEQCTQSEALPHGTRLQKTLAGNPVDLGRVHSLLGLIALVAGQPEETLAELLQARTIYEQWHQYRELAIVCCNLGDLYLRRGVYNNAKEALEQALNLAQKTDYAALISFTTGNLGVVALRQENWSVAAVHLIQAFDGAKKCEDRASMSFWSSYAGQVAVAQGQVKKARAYVVQALIYARQCHVEPYLGIALVTAALFHLASPSHMPSNDAKTDPFRKAKRVLWRALSLSSIETETRIEAQLITARLALLEGDQAVSQAYAQNVLNEALTCGIEWVIPQVRKLLS